MAVMDENNRYPKFVDWGFNLNRTPGQAVQDVRNQVGDGGLAAGVVTREMLRQGFVRPTQNVINSVAGGVNNVVQPTADFTRGLLLGAPPAADAPQTGAPGPNFPTLRSVVSPEQAAPAPALVRTPSRGQPAPVMQPEQQPRANSPAPTYSMDSVPQGGGFMSWGGSAGGRAPGSLSITPDRARELAGQGTTVPAGTIAQLGGGAQPIYSAAPGGQPNVPQRSHLIGDRSNDFDTMLKGLVSQATQTPDSYGALFQRKGVLHALNDIAGVAQGAGTNAAQDIANVRNNIEQRYSTDLTDQARAAERGVTTRGQDRLYESNLLQDAVMARNADLQATTSRDNTNTQAAVSREGYKARSADVTATNAARAKELEMSPVYKVQADPEAQMRFALNSRLKYNAKGESETMTQPEYDALLARYKAIYGKPDPYQLMLPQAQ